ncbi:MAG: minimal chain-length factor beta [Solirubrobacteraceae bacterium]|nr:minimal chain-length factor beta [Solirubrobacteraceae bacterium]MEA2137179.1 minimal chain-length factor beta [Solirubrobacteraceae bacterium]
MITSTPRGGRRAVISGVGVVAPNGIGTGPWWSATTAGTSGIGRITRFDPSRYATRFAGEVNAFDAGDYVERRLRMQTDRWTWIGLAATGMALDDADFRPAEHDPYSMSVITASSSGGNEFGQVEIQKLWSKGAGHVGAYQSIAWFYAATTGQISIRYGMKGASGVVVSEGAGGLDALAHGRRAVLRGVDTVVSGGVEAPISPYALTCQMATGRLSSVADAAAYRPFDERASGYVPGEGGAILLVEELDAARRRGGPAIYGEILGYGATHDGHHPWAPPPDARQLARAIELALRDARIDAREVDVVFADGAGSRPWDELEAQALHAALGAHAAVVPVAVPKTMTGRLYAGGASLDVAAALFSMRHGVIPPAVHVERPDAGLGLDIVRGASRAADVRTALVVARGYGGFNSALVLRRTTDFDRTNDPDPED